MRVLQPDPVEHRAEVVAEMEISGRLHAGENAVVGFMADAYAGKALRSQAPPPYGTGECVRDRIWSSPLEHRLELADRHRFEEMAEREIGKPARRHQHGQRCKPERSTLPGHEDRRQRLIDEEQHRSHAEACQNHPRQPVLEFCIGGVESAPQQNDAEAGGVDPGGDRRRHGDPTWA